MATGTRFEIKHRQTGAVLFSGDGLLRDADMRDADLSWADLSGTYMRGADLSGADMRNADMRGADMRRTSLFRADMRGADLSGADMREANLAYAVMRGADLRSTCVIDLGQRSDGYQFFFHLRYDGEPWVLAGCRYFPLPLAREHWDETRFAGTPLGDETRAILDHGERLMAIRGFTK